jgi:hypothetical protein
MKIGRDRASDHDGATGAEGLDHAPAQHHVVVGRVRDGQRGHRIQAERKQQGRAPADGIGKRAVHQLAGRQGIQEDGEKRLDLGGGPAVRLFHGRNRRQENVRRHEAADGRHGDKHAKMPRHAGHVALRRAHACDAEGTG